MCRHMYDWNIVNCDVKQLIQLKLHVQPQWRSSAPNSGGGAQTFSRNNEKQKKKCRGIIKNDWELLGLCLICIKIVLKGGMGVLPQTIFTELGTKLGISRPVLWHIPVLSQKKKR